MNNLEFFLHMKKVPTVTHQQQRVTMVKGKPVFYEGPSLKAARALFMNLLVPFKPEKMIVGKPIRLSTFWMYGTSNVKKIGTYKITKPDTDNTIKLLKDCMTQVGFWKDDALVSVNHIEKHWAHHQEAGIFIRIEILEEGGS